MLVKEIDFFGDIFTPYPHQRKLFEMFFSGNYTYYMLLWHRRAGKDATAWNLCWLDATLRPGNYVYTLPKISQARNVVFEGKDLNGKRWLDLIPKHLIKSINNTECKIYFNNGSIIHVTGADNLMNAHLGSNLAGFVMSELQKCHPATWDYVRPILKRSNGWAIFPHTALGKGHAHHLFEKNIDNPGWFCQRLTVDDTVDNNGQSIFSAEEIEEERQSGMEEDLIQQEYYCSSDAAIKGTFFAEQIALAYKENRIRAGVTIDPNMPVHTSWDLGSRDTNSIWFFQYINGQFIYFYQHDKNYGSIEYYLQLLQQAKERFNFRQYGHHFMPHDVSQTEWSSGKTRRQSLREAGISITPVPRLRVIERVQCARSMFARCVIDSVNCKNGIEALATTRSKYDAYSKTFVADEVHDWSSHPAAAFEYGHVGWLESYNKQHLNTLKSYARLRS